MWQPFRSAPPFATITARLGASCGSTVRSKCADILPSCLTDWTSRSWSALARYDSLRVIMPIGGRGKLPERLAMYAEPCRSAQFRVASCVLTVSARWHVLRVQARLFAMVAMLGVWSLAFGCWLSWIGAAWLALFMGFCVGWAAMGCLYQYSLLWGE